MALMEWLISPKGLALDRYLVRYTGHSLLNQVFARRSGITPLPALLLRTRGRKTGLWRDVVLPWFAEGADYLVVGSNGGSARDPAWIANLRDHPQAEIFVARRLSLVTAHFAEGEEYQRLWQRVSREVAAYADYQRDAGARQIPLVVLKPR